MPSLSFCTTHLDSKSHEKDRRALPLIIQLKLLDDGEVGHLPGGERGQPLRNSLIDLIARQRSLNEASGILQHVDE